MYGRVMKAYQITEVYAESGCAFVVFAPNANKARAIGRFLYDYYYRYIDIEAKRLPLLDRFYDGREQIDYENSEVKRILVEEYGWAWEE